MKWCIAIILAALLSFSCASPPHHKAYPVLEQVDPAPPEPKEEAVHPNYDKLSKLLLSLGYEPVGMQFETDANLDLLNSVFSNPISHNRRIKLVYTGLQMAYDKDAESLTIGGLTNVTSILAYMQRNVPLNNEEAVPVVPITPKSNSPVKTTPPSRKSAPSGTGRSITKPLRPKPKGTKTVQPKAIPPTEPFRPAVEPKTPAVETLEPVPEPAAPIAPKEELSPVPETSVPPEAPTGEAPPQSPGEPETSVPEANPTEESESKSPPVPESKNKLAPDLIPGEEIPTE